MSPPRLGAQRGDLRDQVGAADDRGGRPGRHVLVGERVGHDVLLCAVDPVGEPAGSAGPRLGRDLIGPPPLEQDFVVLGEPVDDRTHDVRVEELHRPAAVLEAAAGVLGRAAGRLHDAVEAHELADDNSHITLHSGCLLIMTTNGERTIRPFLRRPPHRRSRWGCLSGSEPFWFGHRCRAARFTTRVSRLEQE